MVSLAETLVPSGIAAVIIATTPIWLSVFDALLTRRMPSLVAIGGLLVGLLGVAILLLPTTGLGALNPVGIGILVVAAVSWAGGSLYARRGPLPANQLLGTGMEQIAGGVALLLAATAIGEGRAVRSRVGHDRLACWAWHSSSSSGRWWRSLPISGC